MKTMDDPIVKDMQHLLTACASLCSQDEEAFVRNNKILQDALIASVTPSDPVWELRNAQDEITARIIRVFRHAEINDALLAYTLMTSC
jgi:hypothetical protein